MYGKKQASALDTFTARIADKLAGEYLSVCPCVSQSVRGTEKGKGE